MVSRINVILILPAEAQEESIRDKDTGNVCSTEISNISSGRIKFYVKSTPTVVGGRACTQQKKTLPGFVRMGLTLETTRSTAIHASA